MGKVTELNVTKGKTVKTGDKDEWTRVEYGVKALVDDQTELEVAKAHLEGVIDGWLTGVVKPASAAPKEAKAAESDHPEVYEKLNWESRTGDKGPYQMLRKDNCNDTALFNHLDAILRANKGNVSIGDYHYWAGHEDFIFRRKKKQSS